MRLSAYLLFIFVLVGCGGSYDPIEITPTVKFISVSPSSGLGVEIAPDATICLYFDDAPPKGATVNVGTVWYYGKRLIIEGPFAPGPLSLEVAWPDEIQPLWVFYTVVSNPQSERQRHLLSLNTCKR